MTSSTMARKTSMCTRLSSLAAIVLLAACSQASTRIMPQEPSADTACALDGMLLLEYPGPKAQMHFAEGKPEFYCDLLDMFRLMLSPEQKRPVSAMFVQDMGKTSWEHPAGNWIDAEMRGIAECAEQPPWMHQPHVLDHRADRSPDEYIGWLNAQPCDLRDCPGRRRAGRGAEVNRTRQCRGSRLA